MATLWLPESAPEPLLKAAGTWQETANRLGLPALTVGRYEGELPLTGLVVRLQSTGPLSPERLPDLQAHGYRLVKAGEGVVLEATNEVAAAAGLHRLLHHAGVRWFVAGDLGWDLPSSGELQIPGPGFSESPEVISSHFAGHSLKDWNLRNGMMYTLQHHHRFSTVFPPELFETHPEWFPSGIIPKRVKWVANYQPVLHAPGTVQHALEYLDEYFASHPQSNHAPFSMADTFGWDDSVYTRPEVREAGYFRGLPVLTDYLFKWLNTVAEEMESAHPDRFLTSYAYSVAEKAPSFEVHPHLIPVLTADRAQWFDPEFRREDLANVQAWDTRVQGPLLTYDYPHGAGFAIPRVYLHTLAQSIRELHAAGIDGFYFEFFPMWGYDGPKGWLMAQLMWDVDAEEKALLDEFYTRFYGPAAPAMARFFEICEQVWMRQPGKARWLKYFGQPQQALIFAERDMLRARHVLDEAVAAAEESNLRYAERVQLTATLWTFTEAARAHAEADMELAAFDWKEGRQGIELLQKAVKARQELLDREAEVVRDPYANWSFDYTYLERSSAIPAFLYAARGRTSAQEKAAIEEVLRETEFAELWKALTNSEPRANFLRNADLEKSGLPFDTRLIPSEDQSAEHRKGRYHIENLARGSFQTRFERLPPGDPVVTAALEFDALLDLDARLELKLVFIDAEGQEVGESLSQWAPFGPSERSWVRAVGMVPEGATRAAVRIFVDYLDGNEFVDFHTLEMKTLKPLSPARAAR